MVGTEEKLIREAMQKQVDLMKDQTELVKQQTENSSEQTKFMEQQTEIVKQNSLRDEEKRKTEEKHNKIMAGATLVIALGVVIESIVAVKNYKITSEFWNITIILMILVVANLLIQIAFNSLSLFWNQKKKNEN